KLMLKSLVMIILHQAIDPTITHGSTFDLARRKLTDVTADMFKSAPSTTRLTLDYNEIAEIETGAFSGLQLLEEINLAHNKLTILTYGMFGNLKSLTHLFLYDNDISKIKSGAFSGLQS
ncbi:unnamed protein product, partial [Owenia fusiformis]